MGIWKGIVEKSEEIEKVAKPIALILACLGLLALYVPGLRRWWEELITPAAWYQVGTVRVDERNTVAFATGGYDSPAWNTLPVKWDLVLDLVGKDVLTSGTAVGRDDSKTSAQVETVLDKNQCLHVTDMAFGNFRSGSPQGDAALLSTFPATNGWQAQWAAILAARKAADAPSCQPLGESEWNGRYAKQISAAAKSGHPIAYDSKRPVCARTNIWIKAQKVSC